MRSSGTALGAAVMCISLVPTTASAQRGGHDVDLHEGTDPVTTTLRHDEGLAVHVELDADNGRSGGCFTPCTVTHDAGEGVRVRVGRANQVVQLTGGEWALDAGWNDDGFQSYITGWIELALGGVGTALAFGLNAAGVGQTCSDASGVRRCETGTWFWIVLPISLTMFLTGTIVQIIAQADPVFGGMHYVPHVTASLLPDPSGSVMGAAAVVEGEF